MTTETEYDPTPEQVEQAARVVRGVRFHAHLDAYDIGRAVLAAVLPDAIRQAKAEALREAADGIELGEADTFHEGAGEFYVRALRRSADRIENGADR